MPVPNSVYFRPYFKKVEGLRYSVIGYLRRGIEGGISATIPRMSIEEIVHQLQAERDRLDAAIKALTTVTGNTARPRGRLKRTLSASARRKISFAQKARWAKRASGGQVGTARPKRTMSASARRKIAAAQRARWAKVKAGTK